MQFNFTHISEQSKDFNRVLLVVEMADLNQLAKNMGFASTFYALCSEFKAGLLDSNMCLASAQAAEYILEVLQLK